MNAEMAARQPSYDTGANRRIILDELRDLFRYRTLVKYLIIRNVTARYKRSVLGVAWTLIDPLLTMSVMAIVYSAILKTRIEDFPIFLLSGIIVWNFFSQASNQAIVDLLNSGALIGKVYLPKYIFAVAAIGTGAVNLVFSFIPLVIITLIFGHQLFATVLFLPVSFIILAMFTLGTGLLISAFAVFFIDMLNIFDFLLRLGMYLSGLFYTVDILPDRLQTVIRLIPTYHLINLFREPIYAGVLPGWRSLSYASLWAVLALLVGFWVFSRLSNAYAYRL